MYARHASLRVTLRYRELLAAPDLVQELIVFNGLEASTLPKLSNEQWVCPRRMAARWVMLRQMLMTSIEGF